MDIRPYSFTRTSHLRKNHTKTRALRHLHFRACAEERIEPDLYTNGRVEGFIVEPHREDTHHSAIHRVQKIGRYDLSLTAILRQPFEDSNRCIELTCPEKFQDYGADCLDMNEYKKRMGLV